MKLFTKKSLVTAIQCTFGAVVLSSANAEPNKERYIEEVITTATTQSTVLSDTGISISSIGAMTIDEMSINNFKDFTRTIPGVNYTEGSAPGEQTIIIRGVNFPSNRFQQSTVAVYIDELSLTQNGRNPDIDLVDMERVEVLRGPQGTLYGSSSMGGTLRYISNKPDTSEFYGDVEIGVEETGDSDLGYRLNSTVNIPVSDTLAIRATGYMKDLDGWIDSVGWAGSSSGDSNEIIDGSLAEDNVNSEETTGGRIALRWLASEDLTVDLMYLNHDTEVDGLSNENPYWGDGKQQRRFKETYADKLETYNLALNYDIEEGTFLWNSSKMVRDYKRVSDPSRQRIGLAWWYGDFSDAFDYGNDAFADEDGDFSGHAVRDRPIDFDLETHEFRFSSALDGPMNFVAGAYYSKADNRWQQTETYPGITESKGTLVPFAYPNFYLGTSYEDAATTSDFIVEADGYSGQDIDSDGVVDIFQFEPELYANAPSEQGYIEDRHEVIEQKSVYGNFTYELTDALDVTLGLRWFDVQIDNDILLGGAIAGTEALGAADELINTPVGARRDELVQIISDSAENNYLSRTTREQSEDGVQSLFGATYDLSDDAMAYFTFSEGFRVGGVNRAIPTRDGSVIPDTFDSDDLESYELGLKSKWFDSRVEFNTALFAIDWHDIQISQTDDLTSFDYTENAGEAEIRGIEGELRWLATESIDISVGATYIDHEITEGEDKGSELPFVSNENYYVSARYARDVFDDMNMYARADWTYTGGYQTDTNPTRPVISSYEILNFSVGLINQDWEVTAYVKNALDNDAVIDEQRSGNSAPNGRVNRLTPRTVGASVKWLF